MAIDTAPVDLADLRRDFLHRVRETTGVTATNDAADRALNTALLDIHISPGGAFPWSIRRAFLITHALYNTGTVEITDSARTTVTGSGTLFNTAVTGMGFNNTRIGGKMTFSGNTEVYEVSAVGGDTSITISSRYVSNLGTGLVAGSSYTYFEDEYALASDFYRPVDLREFSQDMAIQLIGQAEFRRLYPRNSTTSKPKVACIIQLPFSGNTTPRYRVVLHPPPDIAYSIPYNYVTSFLAVTSAGVEQTQLVNETDEPIVPLRYRHALVFHALYHWLRDRKDDARSQEAKAEYTDIMGRIANDTTIGQDRPRIIPRTGQYYGYGRRRGSRLGRFDVSGRFDNLLD